ncbi:MAG TPA: PAS domain-containing sensor histidine kinase [Burkholderiales bacterium]|nr:PAS domain-containing sensor histidine kinase [Burkholderiales bacterium]
MKVEGAHALTSVKGTPFRHPVAIALGATSLAILVSFNAAAFVLGLQAPWLLGGVLIGDMLVVGVGIVVAAREVLRTERRSEASEAQLAAIVDSAMDAIISVDEAQTVVLFNRAAETIFRCPRHEALGMRLERFIPERFRAAHRAHVEHFARTGVTSRRMGDVTTLWGLRADGEEFPIEASISQTGPAGGRYYTVILRDITLRRKAEAEAERVRSALGETQRRLGAIVDSAMDAVITVDDAQNIVLLNRAAEQLFGVRREEMLGTPLDRLLPARFRAAHRAHIEAFGRTGVTSRRMGDVTTLWALRPHSGEEFPIEASISQASEEGRRFYTVILRDITRRKQAEDALKASERELRALSARVLEAREEEKTRIARELHDELGQLLTALKMDLGWLRERLPADADLAARAAEMGNLLDRTVSSTRRISADLRPLMLDDLGLADAAAWLVDDFCKRYNVACKADLAEAEALQQVSKSVATAVYRAIQEALTNIARHAHAANAWVILTVDEGAIQLEIEDDGRGIAPDDLAKARSFGLKGMRERITFLGGSVDIARAPRGGTRLRMRVPLRGLAEETAA